MEQLIFGMMPVKTKREEEADVNLSTETAEVLVKMMARAMVVIVRSAEEKNDEG